MGVATTEKGFYLYVVSEGEYSDYGIEGFALHEKYFTKEQMKAILDEVIDRYRATGENQDLYSVNNTKFYEVFWQTLADKGFRRAFSSGEFHLLSYSRLDDVKVWSNWRTGDKEPSTLRIGLG